MPLFIYLNLTFVRACFRLCLINNVSLTGIKDRCIRNEIQTYHVTTNHVVDLMQDLLEGVCHYDFCAMLEELIFVKQYFTLQTLNNRIQNFDYNFDIGCNCFRGSVIRAHNYQSGIRVRKRL